MDHAGGRGLARRNAGYWALDFTTSLRNVRGETLHIGSPTTEGRPLAGYGGLFWRGPRSLDNGEVITATGHEGAEAIRASRALAGLHGLPRRKRQYINARLSRSPGQSALSQQVVHPPDTVCVRQFCLHVQ